MNSHSLLVIARVAGNVAAAATLLASSLGAQVPGATASVAAPEAIIGIRVGDGTRAPGLYVRAIHVRHMTIYGRRSDIARLLAAKARKIEFRECYCGLLATKGEGDACVIDLVDHASRVPDRYSSLPRGVVVYAIEEAADYAALFNQTASITARASSAGGEGTPPAPLRDTTTPSVSDGGPEPTAEQLTVHCGAGDACKPLGEAEFSTDGELKLSLGCEDGVQLEVTSLGDITLKLGSGHLKVAIPVRKSNSRT